MRRSMQSMTLVAVGVPLLVAGLWALSSKKGTPPRTGPVVEGSSSVSTAAPTLASALAERDRRIGMLERRLTELEDRVHAFTLAGGRTPIATASMPPDDPDRLAGEDATVASLRRIALDPARSTRDRVVATAQLWRIDLDTGMTGSRTPEIVDGLLALLPAEPDAELRRQICFNVLGAAGVQHKNPILSALQLDPNAEVRAQAADTLQNLQSEPDVRAALEWSSQHDAEAIVRETAAEMLARWDGGIER